MVNGSILTTEQIEKITWEIVDEFLIPKFNELNMNASGEWLGALEVKVEGTVSYIIGADYTRYLEYGRGAGGRPPIEPLMQWVTDKFGLTGQAAKSAAFAISTKIQKEGTDYFQRGGTDLVAVLESEECLKYAIKRIKEELENNVKEEIIKTLKTIK